MTNVFSRVKRASGQRWAALKDRRPSVGHIVQAWGRMQANNGNQYAAAITYFSFLALFPLLLLGVAITGFVLSAHPVAQQSMFTHITANVPGTLGTTLSTSIKTAIKARTGVGLVGLAGVLLTGLGWIGNLRAAVEAMWGRLAVKRNFFVGKAMNLLVLAGLGGGLVASLGLTVAGTALTDQILRWLSLDEVWGAHALVQVLGLLLAIVGDVIIFNWLLVRLPGVDVPRRIGLRGAVFAAVGFEVLKVVGTYTIAKTAGSPTAGPFAGVVAVLIWIQLVARLMLFCAAWMAVLTHERAAAVAAPDEREPEQPVEQQNPAEPAMNPAALGVTLVGAGAVAGAAATWALTRSHQSPR
ncbi:MAG: YhjD/YihY/BrkB family envelope integrity protein [Jatrophihabitantaceae bacterium]